MDEKKNINKKWIWLIVLILLVIILLISSSMTYSQQSLVPDLDKLFPNQPFKDVLSKISFNYAGENISIANYGYAKFIEFFIRKLAHFVTFGVLSLAIYKSLYAFLSKKRTRQNENNFYNKILAISLVIIIILASLDEFHQMLTGGRTPTIEDVILDSVGGLTFLLINRFIQYRKQQNK
ncbi:hypothetical protein BG261_09310 [Floricoccus tropicus]|uniref:VanZ-like domain-containing protein n=1 Tax=Floricoccus tropicus TaxID=1859473 RepID=A0A1E8GQ46_9LACT|nr:VanZ family protein [Floricoccus tropicus]OFI50156.1 hypothetical protein BG261_09310 [Floricoccus tropicus]